jgi:hypothetical protein
LGGDANKPEADPGRTLVGTVTIAAEAQVQGRNMKSNE